MIISCKNLFQIWQTSIQNSANKNHEKYQKTIKKKGKNRVLDEKVLKFSF